MTSLPSSPQGSRIAFPCSVVDRPGVGSTTSEDLSARAQREPVAVTVFAPASAFRSAPPAAAARGAPFFGGGGAAPGRAAFLGGDGGRFPAAGPAATTAIPAGAELID